MMRKALFQWPSLEDVQPEALPPMPKKIAKNFVGTFFWSSGRDLVLTEAERLKDQVLSGSAAALVLFS